MCTDIMMQWFGSGDEYIHQKTYNSTHKEICPFFQDKWPQRRHKIKQLKNQLTLF